MTSAKVNRELIEVAIAAVVAIIVVGCLAWFVCTMGWNRHCPTAVDPCIALGRGHQIIASGVPFGCTGDSTNYRG